MASNGCGDADFRIDANGDVRCTTMSEEQLRGLLVNPHGMPLIRMSLVARRCLRRTDSFTTTVTSAVWDPEHGFVRMP